MYASVEFEMYSMLKSSLKGIIIITRAMVS